MCETCGCNITHGNEHLVQHGGPFEHTAEGNQSIEVLQNLLHANDHDRRPQS